MATKDALQAFVETAHKERRPAELEIELPSGDKVVFSVQFARKSSQILGFGVRLVRKERGRGLSQSS